MVPWVQDNTFLQGKEWQARYQDYQAFVERLHGKRLLILEFGAGIGNQMIKAPFMQLAFSEPGAFYININKGEIYIIPQIQDNAKCVDGDIYQVLTAIMERHNEVKRE